MPLPTPQESAEGRALIFSKDVFVQRMNAILEAGLRLHEWLHDKANEVEVLKYLSDDTNNRLMDKRLASFAMFFNRIMPAKALILHGQINDKRITPEMLQAMGLSTEAIRRLAEIEVTPEEARDVTPQK